MTNTYTVYKHTSPSGKVYIGITSVEVKRRLQNGTNYKNSPHFYKAILKYGLENISHDILYTNLNKEEAEEKDIELIKEYKSNIHEYGYNTESGGNSKGKSSKETREKMSKSKKGMHYKPRRKHTEAEKKAISETLKGRRSPMRGKHWSVEQRAKVGKAIVCKNTGKVYYSIREAARDTGADRANIGRVLKGIYKQTGGFIFEYTDQSV